MPVSIQDAVDHLYDVVVRQGHPTSPARLRVLADFCVQELERRGLTNVEQEAVIPGAARDKSWDVAWSYDGKFRLGISLKSMLRNIAGTVPNRGDDLIGEVANAQLYSPEIVSGYIMLLDLGQDSFSNKHGCNWSQLLRRRLEIIAGRNPPHWTIGMVEAMVLLEMNFSSGSQIVTTSDVFTKFFDSLVHHVSTRNPRALPPRPDESVFDEASPDLLK